MREPSNLPPGVSDADIERQANGDRPRLEYSRRFYVASSWRNTERLNQVVQGLRSQSHEVYDFREANAVFNWSQINEKWDRANPILNAKEIQMALVSDFAIGAFANDLQGLEECDHLVLIMPCGRSAHLELGWFIGQGKQVSLILADNEKPDLMHLLVGIGNIYSTINDFLAAFA